MDKSQIFYQPLKHSPRWGAGRGLLLLLMLAILAGCSLKQGDTFTDESVQQAAQRYYTYFVNGDAKQYVEGMADCQAFSEEYVQQMQDVITHASNELARRGGVVRVEVLADSLYEADSTACVFLDLVFPDSVHEQVGVPMVFQKSKWRIK